MLVWMFVLKKYDFSLAYPLLSISYIIGLLVAYFFFHETIPLTRWIGVLIVMIGVYLIAK
jgi:undecaprenyl phosphate-alpha-L-ara4N flippase subunit ArnE